MKNKSSLGWKKSTQSLRLEPNTIFLQHSYIFTLEFIFPGWTPYKKSVYSCLGKKEKFAKNNDTEYNTILEFSEISRIF